ncbi:MAG: glycosyltransferase family 9 protein [Bacteroidia bacterium]
MKKILLIQTAFIGDVILSTPILEALNKHYKNSEIDVVVRKGNETLFRGHPFIKRVLVWQKTESKYKNLMFLLIAIRRQKYDLVINCQRFAASGFLTAFSKGKVKIGFEKNPFARFFTYKIPHQIGKGQHECERNLALLNPLGIQGDKRPRLYPPEAKIIPKKPYICIAPSSVWFTKQWPAQKWVELIRSFKIPYEVFLLGAASDKDLCEEIKSQVQDFDVKNMCGEFDLLQSAAFMGGAVMNYVNDSAPMHLCSAVNAPVSVVFCSTVPEFGFGPLSDNSTSIEVKEKLDCRPCGLHGYKACPKGHFNCAEKIEISQLLRFTE